MVSPQDVLSHLTKTFDVNNMIIIAFKRGGYPELFFTLAQTDFYRKLQENEALVSDMFVISKYAYFVEFITGEHVGLFEIVVRNDRYLLILESDNEEKTIHLINKLKRKVNKKLEWEDNVVLDNILKLVLTARYTPYKRVRKDKSS